MGTDYKHTVILFGGQKGWNADDWTDSDDRVRGGKSQSHLKIRQDEAVFWGTLDIDTLGGAGFASQRTTNEDWHLDLSQSDGIVLTVDASRSDDKSYTFIVKDELLPPNADTGREQATISWEYDFHVPHQPNGSTASSDRHILISWDSLRPTYRGREVQPKQPLNTADVRRFSMMTRSFFGSQQGDFTLTLIQIAAATWRPGQRDGEVSIDSEVSSLHTEKEVQDAPSTSKRRGLWSRLWCLSSSL